MASAFTHAAAALALGTAFRSPGPPARFWVLGAVCAALPDLDVLAFGFGIPYEHVLGHRGFSHSLLFAAILATIVLLAAFRDTGDTGEREWTGQRGRLWLFFFLVTASHGVLDALTNGGLGVAFFAPFDNTRYFLPWRPIAVSPINPGRFFNEHGLAVLLSELRWVWLPAAGFAGVCLTLRRWQARRSARAL